MARAKKEEVNNVEEVKDEKISSWANGLRIVCNIIKVLDVIGIIALVLVLCFVPKLLGGIKIEEGKITAFNHEIEYKFKNVDFLTYTVDGEDKTTVNTKEIYKVIGEETSIKDLDMNKIRNVVIIDLIFAIVIAVLEFMIFNLLSSLLKKTRDEGKAFVEGGSKVIVTVMWISLAIYITQVVIALCTSAVFVGASKVNINIDLMTIALICAMYFGSLLYKRGEQLENK